MPPKRAALARRTLKAAVAWAGGWCASGGGGGALLRALRRKTPVGAGARRALEKAARGPGDRAGRGSAAAREAPPPPQGQVVGLGGRGQATRWAGYSFSLELSHLAALHGTAP